MKKYEHRHLAMSVCEHKCNVSEKYVLPQAQAFGLFMATAGLADIHNNSWGHTAMKKTLTATGWQSSPDPNGNQTSMEDQLMVPTLALWLMQGFGRREQPLTEQGNGLQINQTRKEQAG